VSRIWTFPARPFRVVDADSIDVVCDMGMRSRFSPRLRLLRVDAPEIHGSESEAGVEARDFTIEWLLRHRCALGFEPADQWKRVRLLPVDERTWPLLIRTEKGDSFDRWLAEVIHPESGDSLNQDIIDYLGGGEWTR